MGKVTRLTIAGAITTLFILCLSFSVFVSYFINIYQLTRCDFEAPYKSEVIHLVGLVPPASVITVWYPSN